MQYAKQLAAAVGYIALAGSDRVQAYLFNSKVEASLPPLRSKAAAVKLFSFIQSVNAGGAGNMASALGSAQFMPRQPGMAWIFSDLWLEGGLEDRITSYNVCYTKLLRVGTACALVCLIAGRLWPIEAIWAYAAACLLLAPIAGGLWGWFAHVPNGLSA